MLGFMLDFSFQYDVYHFLVCLHNFATCSSELKYDSWHPMQQYRSGWSSVGSVAVSH